MKLAPIILFVYNRPEHTQKTVDALKFNKLAADSMLFIFSDGYKNKDDKISVDEVRNYISTISGFKEVKITLREKNIGLADSVISGVTEIINQYGKAIVVEDDIVTSPYFLKFMNEALDYYEYDERIFTISGYNFPIKIPKEYPHYVYIASRPSSWGWATWNDRWEKVNWNLIEADVLKNKKSLNSFFDKAGKDLAPMLLRSMEGKIGSWSARFAYTQIKHGAYSIFPIKSLIKNIGADLSGTNFNRSTSKYDIALEDDFNQFEFIRHLSLNKKIIKQITRLVRPGIISFIKYRVLGIY
jgi:hypothetical protein